MAKRIEDLTTEEQATFRSEIGAGTPATTESVLALLEGQIPSNMEGLFINVEHPPAGLTALVPDGTTDNCAALQAILDYIGTAEINATVYFPTQGVYLFTGALQSTGQKNAQILLPTREYNEPCTTVKFLGASKSSFSPQSAFSDVPLPPGTVLKTTLNAGLISPSPFEQPPSFIGGMSDRLGDLGVNFWTDYIHVHWENLILQMPIDPVLSGLNFLHVSNVTIKNSMVIAGDSISTLDAIEPTNANHGIIMPHYSSGISQRLVEDVTVWNFYTGFKLSENTFADEPIACMCQRAFEFRTSYGQSRMRRPASLRCPVVLEFVEGPCRIDIEHLEMERGATGAWNEWVADVVDVSNYGIGTIQWHCNTLANGGNEHEFKVTGGKNLFCPEAGFPANVIATLPANQTVAHDTNTQLQLTKVFDARNLISGNTIVAPNYGLYDIRMALRFENLSAPGRVTCGVKVDGTYYMLNESHGALGGYPSLIGSWKIRLLRGSVLTFFVTQFTGSSQTLRGDGLLNGVINFDYVSQ